MPERRRFFSGLGTALAALTLPHRSALAADFDEALKRLLAEIERDLHDTAASTGISSLSPAVRHALETVPRERFIPPTFAARAYENRPLPIGHGQTISQPFIVALMTELLDPKPTDLVLEIGTGSGYQAAVLAACVRKVFSIEIVAPLAQQARAALDAAGVRNVETRVGDGYLGWPDAAPFNSIIVTAAPDHMPPALLAQLAAGGRMVLPVGALFDQELLLVRKEADGRAVTRRTIGVRFVPLTRER
jgi:protein-L-isoaspartate(D-aspartate) O-methyltransferase